MRAASASEPVAFDAIANATTRVRSESCCSRLVVVDRELVRRLDDLHDEALVLCELDPRRDAAVVIEHASSRSRRPLAARAPRSARARSSASSCSSRTRSPPASRRGTAPRRPSRARGSPRPRDRSRTARRGCPRHRAARSRSPCPTSSGTCVPPGASKNANPFCSAVKRERTASTFTASLRSGSAPARTGRCSLPRPRTPPFVPRRC